MPAAITRSEEGLIPEWRRGDKVRREAYSTAQDSALSSRNDLPPRMMGQNFHRRQRNGDALQQDSPISSTTPHDNSYQGSIDQQQKHSDPATSRSPWQRQKSANDITVTGKRKAGLAIEPPSARRQRIERSNPKASKALQDAAYLRKTLDLPTKSEYPNLPSNLLHSPKAALHDATQGLMKLHSTFSVITPSHLKCDLRCMIEGRETVNVFGEGSNKA